ncbi:MAG: AAA family ATPase [Thermoplasmata archaeon]|nr:AAA family ATPase [Thermoplasmata archaeon]
MGYFDNVQGRPIIKDHKALSFTYVPKELPHRDDQMKRMFSIFRSVAESGVSQNVALQGKVGTGKTALAKRFSMEFKDWAAGKNAAVEFEVVNCRRRTSNASVVLALTNHFDKGFPDRGFSVPEMLDIIKKHLIKGHIHYFVILDEVDVLLRKSGSDLIYLLTRFEEEELRDQGSINLILVSQVNVMELMDEASLSTFKASNVITFDRYKERELHDIILQRVDLAFHPHTVDEEVIGQMAAIASETGDARRAIDLLEKSGQLAEEEAKEYVNVEHVRKANAIAYSTLDTSKLDELDRPKTVALLAICKALRKESVVTTGDVMKVYPVTCEEYGEKPRGTTQFWKYIQDMAARGIINADRVQQGADGLTTHITLTEASAEDLEAVLVKRLGS